MKNRRAEIVTVLALGAVVVIGIATVVSSFFLNNPKNKQTTASKAAAPISQTCQGSCSTEGSYCSTCMSPLQTQSCAAGAGVSLVSQCTGGQWQYKYPECRTECAVGSTSPPVSNPAPASTGACGGFKTGYGSCSGPGSCVYRGYTAADPHFVNQWIYCCNADKYWYAKDSNSDDPSKGWQQQGDCTSGGAPKTPPPATVPPVKPPADGPGGIIADNCYWSPTYLGGQCTGTCGTTGTTCGGTQGGCTCSVKPQAKQDYCNWVSGANKCLGTCDGSGGTCGGSSGGCACTVTPIGGDVSITVNVTLTGISTVDISQLNTANIKYVGGTISSEWIQIYSNPITSISFPIKTSSSNIAVNTTQCKVEVTAGTGSTEKIVGTSNIFTCSIATNQVIPIDLKNGSGAGANLSYSINTILTGDTTSAAKWALNYGDSASTIANRQNSGTINSTSKQFLITGTFTTGFNTASQCQISILKSDDTQIKMSDIFPCISNTSNTITIPSNPASASCKTIACGTTCCPNATDTCDTVMGRSICSTAGGVGAVTVPSKPFCPNPQVPQLQTGVFVIGLYNERGEGSSTDLAPMFNAYLKNGLRNDLLAAKTYEDVRNTLVAGITDAFFKVPSTILADIAKQIDTSGLNYISFTSNANGLKIPFLINIRGAINYLSVITSAEGSLGTIINTFINNLAGSAINTICPQP